MYSLIVVWHNYEYIEEDCGDIIDSSVYLWGTLAYDVGLRLMTVFFQLRKIFL
jgi:hypothetical protein